MATYPAMEVAANEDKARTHPRDGSLICGCEVFRFPADGDVDPAKVESASGYGP